MKILQIIMVLLFLPLQASAMDLDIEVTKIPDSTAIEIVAKGILKTPPENISGMMCDYGSHIKLSDSYMAKHVITKQEADQIIAQPFEDADDALDYVKKHTAPSSTCPGTSFVLVVQNMPWPLSNTWAINKYEGEIKDGILHLDFRSVAGSHKSSEGQYVFTSNSENTTHVLMAMTNDMGIRVPGFVIKLAVSKQIPRMFEAMEKEANLISPDIATIWQKQLASTRNIEPQTNIAAPFATSAVTE